MRQGFRPVGCRVALTFACGLFLTLTGKSFAQYTFSTLAQFSTATGENPQGGLAFDPAGDIFGVATYGGGSSVYDPGALFEIAAGTHAVSTFFPFDGAANGGRPWSLISDAQGNLYGVTGYGGADNLGTIFKIAVGTHAISTLASFADSSEASVEPLAFDGSGDLFGTGSSTLFELPAGGNTVNVISTIGANSTGVTFDKLGNMFGSTYSASSTIYEIPAGSNTPSTIVTFSGNEGSNTVGNLITDAAGNIYGTNSTGGVGGHGTVFEINEATHSVAILASFNGANGGYPNSLTIDSHSDLFGTTDGANTGGDGTVFEIPAGPENLETLHTFNGGDGEGPGSLTIDSAGNIYGETLQGANGGDGSVFELSPPPAVPEPASISLFGLVAIGLARRARSKA